MIDFQEAPAPPPPPRRPVYRDAAGRPIDIVSARHISSSTIEAQIGMEIRIIDSADPLWPALSAWAADGNSIAPYAEPEPGTVEGVKAEAGRRLAVSDWMIVRAAEPGGPSVPKAVLKERRAIRDAAARLEAMSPIPGDYGDDRHWP